MIPAAKERIVREGCIRFRLTIAYDGTNYAGWQFQQSGLAVQQCVQEALRKLFPGLIGVQGCSRTDAGVHALALEAHADVPKKEFRIPLKKLLLAINAHLPEDIRILKVSRCPQTFHAQYSTVGKQYRYMVWNHPGMNPLLLGRAWHVGKHLDLQKMKQAADYLIGKQDFRSFAANHDQFIENTIRTLYLCKIQKSGPLLTFIIEGDGFLYKMCRGIVGTLVQVGLGRFQSEDVRTMLKKKDREATGMSAPAHGLTLWKVFYKKPKSFCLLNR